jgi:hypothetical protein
MHPERKMCLLPASHARQTSHAELHKHLYKHAQLWPVYGKGAQCHELSSGSIEQQKDSTQAGKKPTQKRP